MPEDIKLHGIEVEEVGDSSPGPSRDLEAAKLAYDKKDVDASKAAHDAKAKILASDEVHGGAGSEYVKSIVLGGLDGIVTTFAVVAASSGASLSMELLLLMSFASLIADGISMGFGDFLSSKAENDYILHERKREVWEMENYPEGEKKEMIEIYEKRGMTTEDATQVIEIFAKHQELFVDLMMIDELGLQTPDPNDSPAKNGLVTFSSFVCFGSIPLWFYVIFMIADYQNSAVIFAISAIATGLALFALGMFKAQFTNQPRLDSGFKMLLNGGISCTTAYFVGWLLEKWLGTE